MERKKLRDYAGTIFFPKCDIVYDKKFITTDFYGFPTDEDLDREVVFMYKHDHKKVFSAVDYTIILGEKI